MIWWVRLLVWVGGEEEIGVEGVEERVEVLELVRKVLRVWRLVMLDFLGWNWVV